jgi:hypothetical protein
LFRDGRLSAPSPFNAMARQLNHPGFVGEQLT